MKKIILYSSLLLLLVFIGVFLRIHLRQIPPQPVYPVSRHIQYTFTLQNITNHAVKNAEFWTQAPVKQTATQRCLRVESSVPHELITDSSGNQVLHFTFNHFPPYATRIITIKAEILLSDDPNPIKGMDRGSYMHAEKFCESDDPLVSGLAVKLKGQDTARTTANIFQWVAGNIRYAGFLKNPRGARYALQNKSGDCTEYMYLFSALCRANSIPARGIGGYIIQENAVLKPSGYHNWAEFYNNGLWCIADPQRNVFMQGGTHFIAMQVMGKSLTNPLTENQRYQIKGSGIKVKMNG